MGRFARMAWRDITCRIIRRVSREDRSRKRLRLWRGRWVGWGGTNRGGGRTCGAGPPARSGPRRGGRGGGGGGGAGGGGGGAGARRGKGRGGGSGNGGGAGR